MTYRLIIKSKRWDEQTILIDDEDVERVTKYKWTVYRKKRSTFYASNSILKTSLHRFILGLEKGDGKITDHINCDGLDNRKANLRTVTTSENLFNSETHRNAIGVERSGTRWRVRLHLNGTRTHYGTYPTKQEALDAVQRYRDGFC